MFPRSTARMLAAACTLALTPAPGIAEPDCDCPKSIQQTLASPRALRNLVVEAVEDRKPEMAYRYATLLRSLHPESPETDEIYPIACWAFKPIWRYRRLAEPQSAWATAEMAFMFNWLASYYEGDEYPKERTERLLLNMPPSFFYEFRGYVDRVGRYGSPAVAEWTFEFEEDNGRLEKLTATRVDPADATGSEQG